MLGCLIETDEVTPAREKGQVWLAGVKLGLNQS